MTYLGTRPPTLDEWNKYELHHRARLAIKPGITGMWQVSGRSEIHECYDGKGIKGRNPKTTFIAYGADLTLSKLADDDEKLVSWYKEKELTKKNYYLVVGRFVPENSFEVMIREFMKKNRILYIFTLFFRYFHRQFCMQLNEAE